MSDVRLDAILNAAVDAIITIDVDGIIEQANPAASQLFDYPPGAFIGRNISMLMPDRWAHHHDDYLRHHQRTGENRIIGIGREVEGKRRDGSSFPMHLSVGEFVVDGAVHYTGIIHDLSKRKKAESALRRAQKMESIGELTGGIAHDFNNLLTIISGNLELLDMQIGDDGQRELLQDARDAADLGADLTSRLLAFARRSFLEPQVVALDQKLMDLAPMLRRSLGQRFDLVVRTTPDQWAIRIDPGQLESVILNLVINARDAMSNGGRVLIETANVTFDDVADKGEVDLPAGDYIRVSVSDQGDGMVEDVRARAFEPFFTTKEKGKGSGLGLPMVYGFARQSGGIATLYSEPGLGTTVNFWVPRFEDVSSKSVDGFESTVLPRGSGQTVLVVEDEPSVRRLTVQRLQTLGYVTRETETADEAYRLLAGPNDIDIVLTDFAMPGSMNGLELARTILAGSDPLPFVLTSGYAAELMGDGGDSLGLPMLRKPYRQEDLARVIAKALTTS